MPPNKSSIGDPTADRIYWPLPRYWRSAETMLGVAYKSCPKDTMLCEDFVCSFRYEASKQVGLESHNLSQTATLATNRRPMTSSHIFDLASKRLDTQATAPLI